MHLYMRVCIYIYLFQVQFKENAIGEVKTSKP